MRFLGGRFTQRINHRDGRGGPIFRGRFTSDAVKTDAHLVQASRSLGEETDAAIQAADGEVVPWVRPAGSDPIGANLDT
jgi:hypothetical protein